MPSPPNPNLLILLNFQDLTNKRSPHTWQQKENFCKVGPMRSRQKVKVRFFPIRSNRKPPFGQTKAPPWSVQWQAFALSTFHGRSNTKPPFGQTKAPPWSVQWQAFTLLHHYPSLSLSSYQTIFDYLNLPLYHNININWVQTTTSTLNNDCILII